MKKQYKLIIEPITAVHVGTGNKLTPLDYKLIVVKSNGVPVTRYMKYSSDSIMNRIATDPQKFNEFSKISEKKDMKLYHEFFNKNCVPATDMEYLCAITEEFHSKYEANQQKDPLQNASEVEEIFRDNGKPNPVIPGSSIKGAIRTGILNYFLQQIDDNSFNSLENDFNHEYNKGKFEKTLQKSILEIQPKKDFAKTDPFRAVEVSDCIFERKDSQIVGIVKNISVNKTSKEVEAIEKLQMQAEAIKGYLMDSSKSAETFIRINSDLQNIGNGVAKAITIQDIIASCNDFYWNQFVDEYEKFYTDASNKINLIEKLKKELQSISNQKNQFILRLGRWSQCEAVTLEPPFRAPKTPKDKRTHEPKSFGNTRTVFNYDGQYLPFGWCKCTVVEE